VSNCLSFSQGTAALAVSNPLSGIDHGLAGWFHSNLGGTSVGLLKALTSLGSGEWIGLALAGIILFLLWKRSWIPAATMVLAVPGGMLLNEWLKIGIHRDRPFFDDPFGMWSGYSFASGHTIGATLLYGQLAILIVPALKTRQSRAVTISVAMVLVVLVGFSRIALGAHYFTDVLGAILLGSLWLTFCLLVTRTWRQKTVSLGTKL
jgi:undecaprenyl-diphosphatase